MIDEDNTLYTWDLWRWSGSGWGKKDTVELKTPNVDKAAEYFLGINNLHDEEIFLVGDNTILWKFIVRNPQPQVERMIDV
jgi:hypothetical protein